MRRFFSNTYKFYVYTVFLLTLIPFYSLTVVLILNPKTRKWSTFVFWIWSYVLSFLFVIYVRKNKVKTPKKPTIIVANHTSHLDIFLMYQILPLRHIVFMGKHEILNYPLIKTYFKHLHIPVNRDDKRQAAQSMLMAKKKLAEGWSIVIFPEGGIPDNIAPVMAEFKAGAFALAQKNNAAIIPITLHNHYKLLSEPQNWNGSACPGVSKVTIHPLIDSDTVVSCDLSQLIQTTRNRIELPLKGSYF
jgi:1-acyl-sn-glycerol-3-phosphate acyltransferase